MAEELFKNIDQLEDKALIIDHLRGAYKTLSNIKEVSTFFHMYGRCVYGKMEESSRLFQFSLSVQMVALDLFASEMLPKMGGRFDRISDELETRSFEMLYEMIERIPTKLQEKFLGAGEQEAFLAAKNLRWLGHSLQNIDEYDDEKYLGQFKAIYGLAKNILEQLDGDEAKREKTDLFYNTVEFLHELEYPGDTLGAFAELEKIRPLLEAEGSCLHARVKRAQLHNKEALKCRHLASQTDDKIEKIELLKKQYEEISQAVRIANETDGFDAFLQLLFTHNSAKIALQCAQIGDPVLENEEIREKLDIVIAVMAKNGYDHYYHVTFLTTAAQFEMFCGNKSKAEERVDLALSLCEKRFSESCKEEKAALDQLKTEIEAMK
jgi:hypothetical protein